MTETERANVNNQSTIAAFAILEEMARRGEPARVIDLATALGMPRARIYRYLQTLSSIGYVVQDPATERYRLTLKMFHLGQAVAEATQLTQVARPRLLALRDEVSQTATLSIPEDTGMRVIEIARIESLVQIVTRPGSVLPFHVSAQGKVALAFGPPRLRAGMISARDRGDPAYADLKLDSLDLQLEETRRRGWGVAASEILPGICAISAPIFDRKAEFVATVTVVGSVDDVHPDPSDFHVTATTRAARRISADLGCMEYPL